MKILLAGGLVFLGMILGIGLQSMLIIAKEADESMENEEKHQK